MSQVLFLRHGRTAWNVARRIQGHTDVPLDDVGRRDLCGRRLPGEFADWPVFASPLARAVETARLVGCAAPRLDPRLREMSYGDWEGLTWDEIRARSGDGLAAREQRGLDFRPDSGESPREVRARLLDWLRAIGGDMPVVAVTHKGVIRMALAMATGWDLVSRPPRSLHWDRAHLFDVEADPPVLRIRRLNVPLEAE